MATPVEPANTSAAPAVAPAVAPTTAAAAAADKEEAALLRATAAETVHEPASQLELRLLLVSDIHLAVKKVAALRQVIASHCER